MYWFLVDILMVIIVVITAILSMRRGFIASLVRVIGVFIAIAVAVIASRVLSETLFTSFFRESLVNSVAEKLNLSDGIDKAVETLETGFLGLLLGIFGDMEKLTSFFIDAAYENNRIIAEGIVDGVIKTPLVSLIRVIVFLIAFSLTISVIMLIAKLSGAFNAVPVIGGLNRLFGAALGVVYGIGICILITGVISILLTLTGTAETNKQLIDKHSYILSFMMHSGEVVMN